VFQAPSRLRQLDLPPSYFGTIEIPDSVESVSGKVPWRGGRTRRLLFGRESHLSEINLEQIDSGRQDYPDSQPAIFVCLSEEALRRFRCRFETG
jgi:hypothetical protein